MQMYPGADGRQMETDGGWMETDGGLMETDSGEESSASDTTASKKFLEVFIIRLKLYEVNL